MTPTETLRAMLDERGVEYETDDTSDSWYERTTWSSENNLWWTYEVDAIEELPYGTLTLLDTGSNNSMRPAQVIAATLGPNVTGDTSDGYHTFNELYHHRAVLFSVIVRDHRELAWKSKAHHDGTMYDGMFIVGIETPKGQATYHYDIDPYWDMFDCKEFDRAPEWDGHSPADAIERIAALGRGTCRVMTIGEFNGEGTEYYDVCSNCGYEFYDDPLNYCPNCGRRLDVDA